MQSRIQPVTSIRRLREAYLHAPDDHAFKITLRTYVLSVLLTLGPSLAGLLRVNSRKRLLALTRALVSCFAVTGFPFAMTVAIAGGHWLSQELERRAKRWRERHEVQGSSRLTSNKPVAEVCRTFWAHTISSSLAFALLHIGYANRWLRKSRVLSLDLPLTFPDAPANKRLSPSIDFTIIILVRALDVLAQNWLVEKPLLAQQESLEIKRRPTGASRYRVPKVLAGHLDAFIFSMSSARIMWCFFYQPHRLPPSYVKWIGALANVDQRVIETLQQLRDRTLWYGADAPRPTNPLIPFAAKISCPPSWGDLSVVRSHGGHGTSQYNENLGVKRQVGGIPCELVHGGLDRHSCTYNAVRRGGIAFMQASLIYIPVHLLPLLLRHPRRLLNPTVLLAKAIDIARSSGFLSAFVAAVWFAVCSTRTLFLARLLPWVSHNFWDGPYGCILSGSLACGMTIWIENAKRRGEMALYVLPRAIRASLPARWMQNTRLGRSIEGTTFTLALAILLTFAKHSPDGLRGVSRWTLQFVLHGGDKSASRRAPQVPPNREEDEITLGDGPSAMPKIK